MDREIRGRCLVRKSKLDNGEEVLILCGAFYPQNFDINTIHDGDEMWVLDITINSGGLRFIGSKNVSISPEDFLVGEGQMVSNWNKKEKL